MKYILKKDVAEELRKSYKTGYFSEKIGISRTYASLILNRHRVCPKPIAYCLTKIVNSEAEINDFFEVA